MERHGFLAVLLLSALLLGCSIEDDDVESIECEQKCEDELQQKARGWFAQSFDRNTCLEECSKEKND